MPDLNLKIDTNNKIVKFISIVLLFGFIRKLGLWGGLIVLGIALYMGIFELSTVKEMIGFVKQLFV